MKNKTFLFFSSITILLMASSCTKPLVAGDAKLSASNEAGVWIAQTTNGALRPIIPLKPMQPVLAPGQTEYCIPNQEEFYTYIWGYPYGPPLACPYASLAVRAVKVSFNDGSSIYCQPTVIDQFGTIGTGGITLQDLTCNQPTGGFLSYVLLTYYEYLGGQYSATFPLYSCDYSATGYPTGYGEIRMLKSGITYILHSTIRTFSYPVFGQLTTKTIKTIEFI